MALVQDNLRSTDTVELLIGLCAGAIEGPNDTLVNSVHLDDTPIENFENANVTLYQADPMGTTVPLELGGQVSNSNVGVKLDTGTPIVRRGTSVTPSKIRRIEVRILVTQLFYNDERKGPRESSTTLVLSYKAASATEWTEVNTYRILGKTTSNYAKEYAFDVPESNENYDIRVLKTSPAEDSATHIATVYWESFQEVITENPTYKDLSMLHVVAQASDQLSGVPAVWTDLKLRKVKVPTGYDAEARTYTQGIWDGTFQSARVYTNNPIWVLYDIATDAENGVASYYNLNIDKFSAYQVAQWCDQMVSDGQGGMQPRFTLNMIFQEETGAKELLRYIAGMCATTFFDDGNGNAYLKADISTDPVALFTPENVIEGEFIYSYTDVTSRHNDLTVEFINPALNWETDRRRVFDQTSIDSLGRIPHDFTAIGCINEQEAIRRARHHLVTSQKEKQFVSFSTNRAGLALSPYDVFLIADPKVGYGITGRIMSATGRTLTLRDPVTLESGYTYTIKFQVANPGYPDTESNAFDIINRTVTSNSPGNPVTQLTLNTVLPNTVPDNATFSIESTHLFGTPKRFRLLAVEETDGTQDVVQVNAIEVYVNKWAEILGHTYTDIEYSVYNPFDAPSAPEGLALRVEYETTGTINRPQLVGEIRGNTRPYNRYRVSYRRDGGPRYVIDTDDPQFVIEDIPVGSYSFVVRIVGPTGKESPPFNETFVVEDNLSNPAAPQTLAVTSETGVAQTFDLYPTISWSRGANDGFVDKYVVTVKDTGGTVINTYDVDADRTSFDYDIEKINADSPGRSFQLCVKASFTNVDTTSGAETSQESTETCTTVINPRPTVSSFTVSPKLIGSELSVAPIKDADYLRTVFWAGSAQNFVPSDANRVYSGAATTFHYVHYEPMWFKAAILDSYDPTDYNVSAAVQGTPALLGSGTGNEQLAPFASTIAPVVLVGTVAEMNNFLTYPNVNDIPKFVYVTGVSPPVLYEFDPDTHTYVTAIDVNLDDLDLDLDVDVSGIPSNVMPNREMDEWNYFGGASQIELADAPGSHGCLVIQQTGTGQESGCRSPYIPITGGQTYVAGAWIRV